MTTHGTPGPVGFGGPERTNGASRRPEIRLTADWVSRAMGGVARSAERDREFSGVSIDTRTLAPGELFVALRGSRFDGADFVDAALAAGAAGVVVERGRFREQAVETKRQAGPLPVVIEVADAIGALQALAQSIRRESGARVVAITGSAGKTTTKEVTAEFLATRYRVMRNRGNLNNHIGLPL
jgi:UDP-N-acetylmuramoyl-tripeptide--D-alanyl-D-alanine ligase